MVKISNIKNHANFQQQERSVSAPRHRQTPAKILQGKIDMGYMYLHLYTSQIATIIVLILVSSLTPSACLRWSPGSDQRAVSPSLVPAERKESNGSTAGQNRPTGESLHSSKQVLPSDTTAQWCQCVV